MARGNARAEAPPKEKASPPAWSRKQFTGSGVVEVGVWEKMVNEGQDNEFLAFNVSAKRVVKDESGYKTVSGFRAEDVPTLILLLQQAAEYIFTQQNRE